MLTPHRVLPSEVWRCHLRGLALACGAPVVGRVSCTHPLCWLPRTPASAQAGPPRCTCCRRCLLRVEALRARATTGGGRARTGTLARPSSCRACASCLRRRRRARCGARGTSCTRTSTRTITASGTRRTACWSAWRRPRSSSCGSRRGAPALAGVLAPHGNPAAGVTAAAEQQVRQRQLLQQAQRARPC